MKIIDFHTHTFDENIADRAIKKLSSSANIVSYSDGTDNDLIKKNEDEKISLSVVLPVATKIMQADSINARSYKKNNESDKTGLLFFAAIHPDDSSLRVKLSSLKNAGFRGIKLHPTFQSEYIDEKNYLELIDIASELSLITVIHAGEDISFPGNDFAGVNHILNMLKIVKPENIVLAHMGGWKQWDMVESDLAGADVYFDTSFCLGELKPYDKTVPSCDVKLSKEQFKRIMKLHGSEKILFGSDSPWSDRKEAVNQIVNLKLSNEEQEMILHSNAKRLLKMYR